MSTGLVRSAFSQLLLSGTLVHVAKIEQFHEKYGININPQVVMLISIDRYPELSYGKQEEWKIKIGQRLTEEIECTINIPYLWMWVEEGVLALLLEVEHPDKDGKKRKVEKIAEEIQKGLDFIDIIVSIGIGNFYDQPNMLHQSFAEAKKSMSGRFFQGNQLIFHTESIKEKNQTWMSPLTGERTEILALVRIGDVEGAVSHIKRYMEQVSYACNFDEEVFKAEVVDLLIVISRMVLEMGVNPSAVLTKSAYYIQELYQVIRYDKFSKKACEYSIWLIEQAASILIQDVSPPIKSAIRFIILNHQKSITLEQVAHYCHLSKFHFSHLFKKELGISVIDFLNKVRIDKAKYYLENTELNVQEIANLVGFTDANYFSRLFKKYINVSPKEYRSARLC
ncbi:AraC family transcriptional regulator [Neobacillus terrae]|uniref:AraC family transcriptional regulator n=1 Tax=Neobacillus terrae TaxID=3034837 RepID=UPI00140DD49E|nr:helix-turn-helix domain-containing protein [Neobacillus terrae]NHM33070.1 helix-turn-helix transcriptional regulator [Neobacillus terrae]